MEGIHRQLLADSDVGDVVGPFFGFMGAAAALVFACKLQQQSWLPHETPLTLFAQPKILCSLVVLMLDTRWLPRCSSISVANIVAHCRIACDRRLPVLLHLFVFVAGFGAAYGTAKSGVGIASMGVMRPELVMKSIVPVVMAGVLGIYGLIIAVIISTGSK